MFATVLKSSCGRGSFLLPWCCNYLVYRQTVRLRTREGCCCLKEFVWRRFAVHTVWLGFVVSDTQYEFGLAGLAPVVALIVCFILFLH